MIKELSEKIIKLNEKDLNKIEGYFLLMGLLLFLLSFIFGNIVGHYEEQITITDKLISLSEKENNPFPDNNYFKIDNNVYEVKKVNTLNINFSDTIFYKNNGDKEIYDR